MAIRQGYLGLDKDTSKQTKTNKHAETQDLYITINFLKICYCVMHL